MKISSLAYVHMPRSSVPTSSLPYISLTLPRWTLRRTQLNYSPMMLLTRYSLGRPSPIPILLYQHTVARALCSLVAPLQIPIRSTRPSYIDRYQCHLHPQLHRRTLAPHSCSLLRTSRKPPDMPRRTSSCKANHATSARSSQVPCEC